MMRDFIHNNFVNPFAPNAPFLYSLETTENLRFSYVFKGLRKGALGTNGLTATETLFFLHVFLPNDPFL